MILEIDIEKISEVLLADGWHKVSQVGDGRSSFGMGNFELQESKPATQEDPSARVQRPESENKQENNDHREPTPNGARWTEADGSRVFCPVTSILAVKYAGQKKSEGSRA